MPKDVWSEDRVQRAIALQERSDAVAADTTPSINALAPLEPDPKPSGVLLRRVSDGRVIHREDAEAERLIQSGDYRPLVPDETWTENGTRCCGADPEEVAYGRRERIRAVVTQQARAEMDAMAAQISSMSDEEIDALESSVIQPVAAWR